MDEIPDRAIADGNAAFGEFRHEPAHGHLGLGAVRDDQPAAIGAASDEVTYWVPTGSRSGAVIDRITLYPRPVSGSCGAGP